MSTSHKSAAGLRTTTVLPVETKTARIVQHPPVFFLAIPTLTAYSEGSQMISLDSPRQSPAIPFMAHDLGEHDELIHRVTQGDEAALARLFSFYHDRLWRIVNFRLDRRLRGRVDADDVMQEAFISAAQRMDKFLYDHPRSLFIWLRMIVTQTLVDVHRRHIGAQKRDASREVSVSSGWSAASTSYSLSFHLLGHLTSPSQAVVRAELSDQIDQALEGMSEIDREVLALRHFEELTNIETAHVLEMSEQAASIRYIRAISRLRDVLELIPGFFDE